MGDVQTRILKHILLRMSVALAYLFNTPNDQGVKCRISTLWLSLFHRYKKNGYIHICILYICSLHLLCCDIMRPLFCACLSFACNDTLLDGNTKSKNMTMIYCIRDSRFISPPPILKPCSPGFEAPCCARRPVLSMRFLRDCRRRDFASFALTTAGAVPGPAGTPVGSALLSDAKKQDAWEGILFFLSDRGIISSPCGSCASP